MDLLYKTRFMHLYYSYSWPLREALRSQYLSITIFKLPPHILLLLLPQRMQDFLSGKGTHDLSGIMVLRRQWLPLPLPPLCHTPPPRHLKLISQTAAATATVTAALMMTGVAGKVSRQTNHGGYTLDRALQAGHRDLLPPGIHLLRQASGTHCHTAQPSCGPTEVA